MFIGGIARETTEDSLRAYFAKYGNIKDCILMVDKMTGNSRGFGFVTYSDPSSIDGVLKNCPHTLDNKRASHFELNYHHKFILVSESSLRV